MLHSILFTPFPDEATEARFEDLQATLVEAATEGVLLVNLPLPGVEPLLTLVQPGGVTLFQLVTEGGQLATPDFMGAPWLLDGQPLAEYGSSSPWQQFGRQRAALAEWLSHQPELPEITPTDIASLVVFTAPVQFATDVEAGLEQLPTDEQFQLVPQLHLLPRRLQQQEPRVLLPPAALQQWAEALRQQDPIHEAGPVTNESAGFVARKLRQLWGWLGAEDVPPDPPYGGTLAAGAPAVNEEEKHRLEQLRQQVFDELRQQRQEMETREAEREARIQQLRQQLQQLPTTTPDVTALQARLAAEMQEKQQLQQAIQASRAEAETRNQALDARIQQLSQQLEQLQRQPVAVATHAAALTPARATRQPVGRKPAPTWRLQWARAALVVGSVGALGVGLWGVTKLPALLQPPRPATTQAPASSDDSFDDNTEAAAPTLFDIQPDTIATDSIDDSPGQAGDAVVPDDSLEAPARAGELLDSIAPDNPSGDI
ncbi:hypothetical protein [Hymenobacter pini]|uniref:hypothetical protein n=1 Tax=Hymenobacter pini TaxID=2880879 RepID=UPI001CF56D8F|nr:hypothetical protein [Hymenobacter pini]MCA8832553.1 hypothetical protein [Hymenobacter pini]